MPTDRPTLATWLAMTPAEIKEHIGRGVMPPMMGAEEPADGGEGGTGGEGDPKPAEPAAPSKTDEDVANLKSTLDKVRDELKTAQTSIKELKPKAEAHDRLTAEQQTELEKAQKEAADAKAAADGLVSQIQAANLKVALADAKHGLASPTLAALAIKNAGIEFDDNNQPKDLEAAVKAAIEAEPALAGKTPARRAPGTNGGEGDEDDTGPKLDAEELEAAKAAGMTPEEYAHYRDHGTAPPEKKTGT